MKSSRSNFSVSPRVLQGTKTINKEIRANLVLFLNHPHRSLDQLAYLKRLNLKKRAREKQATKMPADLRCSQLEAR
jgi:hypothetical protein